MYVVLTNLHVALTKTVSFVVVAYLPSFCIALQLGMFGVGLKAVMNLRNGTGFSLFSFPFIFLSCSD